MFPILTSEQLPECIDVVPNAQLVPNAESCLLAAIFWGRNCLGVFCSSSQCHGFVAGDVDSHGRERLGIPNEVSDLPPSSIKSIWFLSPHIVVTDSPPLVVAEFPKT